jgi:hypothetical protein
VPVTFFTADEEYGTWVDIPGLGTYSHTSDLVAPAGADIGPPLGTRAAPPAPVSWGDFRTRRLAPLERGGGRLIWQFGENEELVRMFLDDSVERGGFAAISTFHFGNPDFQNTEPFLNRWRGPDSVHRAAGRARHGAVVVLGSDVGLPHAVSRARTHVGRVAECVEDELDRPGAPRRMDARQDLDAQRLRRSA